MMLNLIYLTVNYMEYDTDTNVAPHLPVKLNVTKFSLCVEINSLMDSSPHGFSFDTQPVEERNVTFDHLFNQMPRAESTIDSCKYRDFNLNILLDQPDGRKCAQLFKVIRFRMQGFMCYRFDLQLAREYSYHAIVNSLYEPRELFYLNISSPLNGEIALRPLLHFDDFPDDVRSFGQSAHREGDSTLQLSYGFYESYRLHSPYETHCKEVSSITCYQKCLDDAYGDLGFAPDSGLVVENSSETFLTPMPLVTNVDLENNRSTCYDKCRYEGCTQKFVITSVRQTKNANEKLLFIVETVNRLVVKIVYLPKFSLMDYLTQVGSVVAIWTGLAVINLCKLVESREQMSLRRLYFKIKSYWVIVRIVLTLCPKDKDHLDKNELCIEKSKLQSKFKKISIWTSFIKLAILPIFAWQLLNVAENYFQYQTTAKFNYDMNPQIHIPTLGFCIDYEDLFDGHLVDLTEQNYHEYYRSRNSKHNFTLRELFKQTPNDGLIDGCFMRHWSSRFKRFHFHNGSSCMNYFSVKKFVSNHKLCYRVVPQVLNESYFQSDIKLLPSNPGIIYSIILGPKVPFPHKLHMMTQFGSDLPVTSIEYSVFVYRSESKNMVVLTNRLYRISLMPSPYDTACNPGRSMSGCFEKCIFEALDMYKRISYGSTEERNLDRQFLSYTDLLNGSFNTIWRQKEKFCHKKCWQSKCNYNFTITSIKSFVPVKKYQKLFAVDLPDDPTLEMATMPIMTVYGLMYQIFCCCSFWLGLSFIDLKPSPSEQKRQLRLQGYLTQMYMSIEKVIDKVLATRWSPRQKLRSLDSRKALELIVYFLSICFCCYHLVDSMNIYLTYSSFINVHELMETRTDAGLLICLDTAELISRKFPNHIEDPLEARSDILNRTVTSLFEDTPKVNELIRHCGHWGLYSRRANISQMNKVSDRIFFATKDKTICDNIYEIQKVVIQSYMCYLIRPRNYSYWSRTQMKHTLNQQKTLLKVSVDTSLLTKRFTLMVTFAKYVPFSSSAWALALIQDPQYDRYMVSYIRYIESLLPSPKTNDGFTPFLFDRCLNNCVNKKIKSLNLTLSQRFPDPSNFRFVSYFDRKRKDFGKVINDNQNHCEYKCLHYNDHIMVEKKGNIEIYVPTVEARRIGEQKKSDLTSFYLKSTNHPILSITFKLQVSLFEQVINLGSIVGLWFGFSAMSLAKMSSIRDKKPGFQDLFSLEQRISKLKNEYCIW